MLVLMAVGFVLGAVLVPLIGPVGRALGLMRANFAGVAIPTATGWVVGAAVAAGVGIADCGLRFAELGGSRDLGRAMAGAALLYGALGFVDDRWGDRAVKGLRGHLRCLFRDRRVTTGLVKAAGGAVIGLALTAWLESRKPGGAMTAGIATILVGGAVMALSANAINLLDLRPLRAIKGFLLYLSLVAVLAALVAPARLVDLAWLGLPVGALAAYAPVEARCRAMLGDTGANALGAIAGLAAVWALPVAAQAGMVAALLALHLFAERRSITAALAAHAVLDRLDRWGWANASETIAPRRHGDTEGLHEDSA